MFRQMRRFKQQVTEEDCIRVLKQGKRGVLAVIGDEGYPYAIPVNYYYAEEDGKIWIHAAKEGHKIDAIRNCDKVCFTIWDQGEKREGDWAPYVTSVVCFGRAELDADMETARARVLATAAKYFPPEEDTEAHMNRSFARVQMIAVRPEHMTGKLVHEK